VGVLALLGSACAARRLPSPQAVDAARQVGSYSARLRVSVHGPAVRARTPVLVGFRRPDALRLEIPGPAGARLVAVARGATLWAVFPADRGFFVGAATEGGLEDLFGVALTPSEIMDLLVGVRPARLSRHDVRWGPELPRSIDAVLPDGTRLKVGVEDPRTGMALPDSAFEEPPHEGYRQLDADEARRIWGRR
jgi:hypothetical protein